MKKNNLLFIVAFIFLLWSCGNKETSSTEKQEDTTENANDNHTEENDEQAEVSEELSILEDLLKYNSEVELMDKFGKENVTRSIDYLPEGMGEYSVTKMYEGTPDEVIINWEDTTKFEKISFVEIKGSEANKWSTSEGLKLGMGLDELVKINEKAVEFSGFGWDYAGFVQFKEGKLENKKIGVRLDLPKEKYENPDKYNALMGDTMLSSDTDLVKEANPIIISISAGTK